MTIEKLANTSFSEELETTKLANNSKLSWKLIIEKFVNDMDSKLERLANEIDNRFFRIEDRMKNWLHTLVKYMTNCIFCVKLFLQMNEILA